MALKISQLTAKGSNLADTDLVEVSVSAGGGAYVSRSITGLQIKNAASAGLTVGTTAITSGTVGRILFEGTGNVLQEEAGLTYTTGALLVGNTTAASKSGVRVWNGTTGNTAGAEFYIGTDNNIYLKTNNANNLYISTPTHNVISLISNQASITRLNVNGASTTPTLSVAAEATTSGSYPFYISGLASTRFTLHNGAGQFGINKPSNTLGANLDVSASGALSTDIVFRIRNSADSGDIFSVMGNGEMYIPQSAFNNQTAIFIANSTVPFLRYSGNGNESLSLGFNTSFANATNYNTIIGSSSSANASSGLCSLLGWSSQVNSIGAICVGSQTRVNGANSIKIGNDGGPSSYGGANSIHLGKTISGNSIDADNVFMTYFNSQSSSTLTRSNGSFGLLGQQAYILGNGTGTFGVETFMGNGGNTLVVSNHTSVPSTNITNSFQLYSNDITAGNAAPHFRTENGAIVKLYQETTGVAAATLVGGGGTTLTDTDTFNGYTIKQVVKALQNLGILA